VFRRAAQEDERDGRESDCEATGLNIVSSFGFRPAPLARGLVLRFERFRRGSPPVASCDFAGVTASEHVFLYSEDIIYVDVPWI